MRRRDSTVTRTTGSGCDRRRTNPGRCVVSDPHESELTFTGDIWYWRGPAPFYFVSVPDPESAGLQSLSADVSYGWGMIPVRVRIGGTEWETSLWPKDGGYIVPIKDSVRRAEDVDEGDAVTIAMTVSPRRSRR